MIIHHALYWLLGFYLMNYGALINLDLKLCVKSSFTLVMILLEIAGSAGDERGNKYNLIQIWL